ncbi:E motif [Dillenia turbinata]|uniref:E motif n=1 Tax=Dillenia turbinata TaxID=194707 RepID=A0AAN8YUW6_9MAGN
MPLLHTPSPSLTPSSMSELKQLHSLTIRHGLSSDNDAMGRLIKFCSLSPSGNFGYALQLFKSLPHPDPFIYNTIIGGYVHHHFPHQALLFYSLQMLSDSVPPNQFTLPSLIRACCLANSVPLGNQLHAHVFKLGFAAHVYSQNNLIHMYASFRCLEDARKVFHTMPVQNAVTWASLITGYSEWGLIDDAFHVFETMPKKERNSDTWNAMITAYIQNNRFQEAFVLFQRMQSENVALNKYAAASMLAACTGLGTLEQGEWMHRHIIKSGVGLDSKLVTAVINMYCKCGCLNKALQVFNRLTHRGISTWNCMIGGLAMHGQGEPAIELFKAMETEGMIPDYITFINVLSACANSGLVNEGLYYFNYMKEVHGIDPTMEHFGCMVDLLGKAGLLEEAMKLLKEMPMSPDASVLGAISGACKIHGNTDLGEIIGKELIQLDSKNSGRYISLANLYASAGKWEQVGNVRKLMNDLGVKKVAGFSVIEMNGIVNEFVSGGTRHPQCDEIYAKVDEMLELIKPIGYMPASDVVLHDINKKEKEISLAYHSEKLAIAYGLLKTKPGDTLRISKNLRVCRDCHHACKLISLVFERDIVLRDRNRFHHFSKGECSCKDYW